MINGIADYVGIHNVARLVQDSRSSRELAVAVIRVGERLLSTAPCESCHTNIIDKIIAGMHSGAAFLMLRNAGLYAGMLLELQMLGEIVLTLQDIHDCRAMIARHDLAEGPGHRVVELLHE